MFFKVSNTAKKEQVQEKFGKTFRYPELYSQKMVINGLGEDNLHVVTTNDSDTFQMAIWGLMPEGYAEDWTTFQNMLNTLNLPYNLVNRTLWIKELLKKQRCLILVTGFFTYYIKQGEVYPYYISLESDEPFYLGGVYTKLQDGFLSCGILTTKLLKPVSNFHNLNHQMPLSIPESIASEWISKDFDLKYVEKIIDNPPKMKFRANPIAKEFFKNNIVYESILQPVYYEDILDEE